MDEIIYLVTENNPKLKAMITLKQLRIYYKYNHEYEVFDLYGQEDEKEEINSDKWQEIKQLAAEIRLMDNRKLTHEEQEILKARIADTIENERAYNLLHNIARDPNEEEDPGIKKTNFWMNLIHAILRLFNW